MENYPIFPFFMGKRMNFNGDFQIAVTKTRWAGSLRQQAALACADQTIEAWHDKNLWWELLFFLGGNMGQTGYIYIYIITINYN